MIIDKYRSNKIRLVCATRVAKEQFFTHTALGRSLKVLQAIRQVQLVIYPQNERALPAVYNAAIAAAQKDPAHLVFLHDDILLVDFLWAEKILEGLGEFHIIGLAGNRRRVPRQPSWAFVDEQRTWDESVNLSGLVGHGTDFPCNVSYYGPSKQSCKLLDGVLLAANSVMLADYGLAFDERFTFHLYDMDFCRQAELKGLSMGTWPLYVIHASGGSFLSPAWHDGYRAYITKYGEPP